MAVEIKVPQAGESITEVQIGEWMKSAGDFVETDEIVVEIETDKASMELPAPASGVLTDLKAEAGDIVAVGTVIATIDETQTSAAGSGKSSKKAKKAESKSAPKAESTTATEEPPRVMPAAERALAQAGLDAKDVEATGPGGRLLKEDVDRHLAARQGERNQPTPAASAVSDNGHDRQEETVPMTMLRRRIAQRLVDAQQTAAMLTTFNEIDMSAIKALRKERGEAFEKKYGVRLGFMSFFIKAAIDALKLFPAVNAEIRENDIVYKNYYDIGVAVSTDQGLLVPVVRNAERMSFAELEQTIGDMAKRARDRKIQIEELQGGTFTITNGGVFGSLMATPIINPPQSAILGLHAIKDRPIALDGEVVIRPMMYVALTYDHRIIDGRESVTFLRRIKECIEDPTRMLVEV